MDDCKKLTGDDWKDCVDRTLIEHAKQHSDHRENFAKGEATMNGIINKLDANTTITQDTKTNTDELVAAWKDMQGFFRVMKRIGSAAKWVAGVGAAIAAVLGFMPSTPPGH